jgi:hypothetical protein
VVGALDRRVDLEQVMETVFAGELVALECVLALFVASGPHELGDRSVLADRVAELVIEREKATADPLPIDVRPDEDAVLAPDLDAEDVRLPANAGLQAALIARRDDHAVAAHQHGPDEAVDVARKRGLLGTESLSGQRAREEPAQRDASSGADQRRREQKDPLERQRPFEVARAAAAYPLPRALYRPCAAVGLARPS